MAQSVSVVLRFFLLICTITGLDAAPYNSQSLGVLSELISQDSNSPLIVVVDPANHARAIDLDSFRSNSNSYHNHDHRHENNRELADAYDAVAFDILRTNQMLDDQRYRGDDRQIGVAEQCSDSQENSCSKDGDGEKC